MDAILDDLNLSHLKKTFSDNKVGPTEVLSLTDDEYNALGIEAIGKRVQLRQRCKYLICASIPESPIVQRVKMFQSRRRRQGAWRIDNGTSRGTTSTTRKIKLGWKHKVSGSFNLISASKGGGAHDYNAEKDLSLVQLERKICELYFPEGKNQIQDIMLSNLNVYLANFSGSKVPDTIDGEPFTLDLFYKSRKSHPIRVYLHTYDICEQDIDGAVFDASEQVAVNDQNTDDQEISQNMDDSSVDELPEIQSGTPSIIFNTRRRLQREVDDQTVVGEHQHHSIAFTDNNIDVDIGADHPQLDIIVADESLNDILQRLASQTADERSNLVNVSRYSVLQGATRAFKRKTFNPTSRLSVKFVDELAIDEGGPTKEFLRLLMSELVNLPIFCGPDHAKMLDLNYPALQDQTYELVGQMIAYSIVHSGPMPSFLHPLLYDAMTLGIDSVQPTTDHIMDHHYRDQAIKLSQTEEYTAFEDLIQMAGCSSMATTLNRRDEMCKAITKFIVFGRVHQCFDQFCRGLATLGVLAELKIHGNRMKELFVHEERPLDATTLEILFNLELSEANSNRRRAEEVVVSNWRDFLLDLEEGTDVPTLRDLLVFVTGADGIPPLGLHPSPKLLFHQISVGSPEDPQNFPYANTCANSLSLPLMSDYEVFKKNMIAAIEIRQFTTE